ncbi:MAG: hypothetical protein IPK03_04770 [Bacteroidetes bacterium]|nr:hypothetical protein [Bacteroidota bacterium]
MDHKFVAYSMSIPAALKIKNREPKYLLKKKQLRKYCLTM